MKEKLELMIRVYNLFANFKYIYEMIFKIRSLKFFISQFFTQFLPTDQPSNIDQKSVIRSKVSY